MWTWAALWCAAVVWGGAAAVGCDVGIGFDTYRKETLVSGIRYPTGLAVDHKSDLLYFSYLNKETWLSAKVDLGTKAVFNIEELAGCCSFAVDQELQQVYAGCGANGAGPVRGLHQFDSNLDRFEPIGEETQSVHFVYFKDELYYSVDESLLVHTHRKGHSARVHDLPSPVYRLAIDAHGDRIFYNATSMYRQRARATEATKYEGVGNARALAVDARGAVYGCDYNVDGAVYRLPGWTRNVLKLLDVTLCTGLAFDRGDNIIYAEYRDGITRLVKC